MSMRPPPSYDELVSRILRRCRETVPQGGVVLVLSKGDDQLLRLDGPVGRHFPANERGQYVGHHPQDSRAAIELLEVARKKGGEYLLIPATGAWWLEYYKGFAEFLEEQCQHLAKDECCSIYCLTRLANPERQLEQQHKPLPPSKPTSERAASHWEPASQLRFARDYPETLPLLPPAAPFDAQRMQLHWVIPDFSRGMGGHAVIFRFIHLLERFGHENTIWIREGTHYGSGEKARDAIRAEFSPLNAPVRILTDNLADIRGDAVIATHCWTAYPVRAVQHVRERFYFVQDLEPLFYPMGTEYLLAEATYRFGFTCIVSSRWLQTMLRTQYGARAERFIYAYDHAVYQEDPATIRAENRIAFYARSSTPRRAVDLGLLALDVLAQSGRKFTVDFFGGSVGPIRVPYDYQDHGVLDDRQLASLYRAASVGVVFSSTNYSLIPHEMMGCGLPVLDLDTPGPATDFPADTVTLAEPTPQGIAAQLGRLFDDKSLRDWQAARARTYVSQLSWEGSARKVEQVLIERLTRSAPAPSAAPRIEIHGAEAAPRFVGPIVFAGQPEYYRSVYYDLTSTGDHFEFPISSGDPTVLRNLPQFARQCGAKTCIIFRPEWLTPYPETFWELKSYGLGVIGYSTEPVPHRDTCAYSDQLRRLSTLRAAMRLPYDLLIHFDSTSMAFLGEAGFRRLIAHPLPVSRKLFYPEERTRDFDACFLGKSTLHREEMLAPLKMRFNLVHVAHGLRDEEARTLMNRSRLVLNLHNDVYDNFENRAVQALFCQRPVLSERLTGNLLVPGRDYILVDTPEDLLGKVTDLLAGNVINAAPPQVDLSIFEIQRLLERLTSPLR